MAFTLEQERAIAIASARKRQAEASALNPSSPVDLSGTGLAQEFASVVEPALAIGSGLASSAAGGLVGLTASTPEAGARTVEDFQKAGTFVPRTIAGQQGLQKVGDLIEAGIDVLNVPISGIADLAAVAGRVAAGQPVDEAFAETDVGASIRGDSGLGGTLGEGVFGATENPELATTANLLPDTILALTGLRSIGAKLNNSLVKQINEAPTDSLLSKYIIDGSGIAKKDGLSKKALNQGADETTVAVINGGDSADKLAIKSMIESIEVGLKSGIAKNKESPFDAVGTQMLARAEGNQALRKKLGPQVDAASSSLSGKIDISGIKERFASELTRKGVKFKKNVPQFKGSEFADGTPATNLIKKVVKDLAKMPNEVGARAAHRLKKRMQGVVSFEAEQGALGTAESLTKNAIFNVNKMLNEISPKYAEVNKKYSATLQATEGFSEAFPGVNITKPSANKDIGLKLRALTSDSGSKGKVIDSIKQLEDVFKSNNIKPKGDIFAQATVADRINRQFGILELAEDVTLKEGLEAAQGSRFVRAKGLAAIAVKTGRKLIGRNEENAIKSLKRLTNRTLLKKKATDLDPRADTRIEPSSTASGF